MRYLFILFVFILGFSKVSYSEINVNQIRYNGNPPQLVIDIGGAERPKYQLNYDDVNRLIFLEFDNSKLASNFVNNAKSSSYVSEVKVIDYEKSVGIFILLEKNVDYKLSYRSSPVRFVIDFSRKTNKKEYTIVLDPGHGGRDSGAIGYGHKEKDVVLSVSKYVREYLKDDFNIIMTRSEDEFISLNERAAIGNRSNADLFVSVHANSAGSTHSANGFETFYYSRKSSAYAARVAAFENSAGDKYGEDTSTIARVKGETEYNNNKVISAGLADILVASYSRNIGMRNRGTHGANFAVLRGFRGPGILVELGFISGSEDITKLKSDSERKKMAKEIADAIRHHFRY